MLRADEGLLGERAVYPGHPVTVALCITLHFVNWESAFGCKPSGYPAAVADSAIPGAGGCVFEAMSLLYKLRSGLPFEQAVAEANATWLRLEQDPSVQKSAQEQADRIVAQLAEQADWWTEGAAIS